ncbi:hypothetical protein E0K89_010465 [Aquicoccus sp. SCR17]|nr:hypothetical protein [Carideicomes alvinocaridis]
MAQKDVANALIDSQGRLFSEQVGANIARDVPQQWFHWLLTAQLCSARIAANNALQAAAALRETGLHKIEALLESRRADRIRVLNKHGYARFDNIGADQVRDAAELVQEKYHGDLRELREAGGDAKGISARLQEVKGIGETGAGIFCREAQLAWDELYPQADKLCLKAAEEFGLPADAKKLADLAGSRERFVRLLAALARAHLDGPSDEVESARRH